MPSFTELQSRLVATLKERVQSGELTERGIARLARLSQPHIHNVLNGKRLPSFEASDAILQAIHLDAVDLLRPDEVARLRHR